MQTALRGLEKIASVGAKSLAIIGLVLLLGFAAMTLLDGLTRAIAGRPIDIVRDLGNLVVAIAVGACLPWSFQQKTNITITFIGPLVGRKPDRIMIVVAAILTWLVLIAFAWQFYLFAGNLARAGETTAMLDWPKAPFWYVVDAWLWWAVFVQAMVVVREALSVSSQAPIDDAQAEFHADF